MQFLVAQAGCVVDGHIDALPLVVGVALTEAHEHLSVRPQLVGMVRSMPLQRASQSPGDESAGRQEAGLRPRNRVANRHVLVVGEGADVPFVVAERAEIEIGDDLSSDVPAPPVAGRRVHLAHDASEVVARVAPNDRRRPPVTNTARRCTATSTPTNASGSWPTATSTRVSATASHRRSGWPGRTSSATCTIVIGVCGSGMGEARSSKPRSRRGQPSMPTSTEHHGWRVDARRRDGRGRLSSGSPT